ncbi:hypothetical protein VDG1235_2552 [Verrucomicrobiia bacterium DG1235]|nr:hypothetical protein VDG1235_2552 [Verrucomicrobiae bacterium DG1235]
MEEIESGQATIYIGGFPRELQKGNSLFRSSGNIQWIGDPGTLLVEWLVTAGQYGEPVVDENGNQRFGKNSRPLYRIDNWKEDSNFTKKEGAIEKDIKELIYHAGRTRGGKSILYTPANGESIDTTTSLTLKWTPTESGKTIYLRAAKNNGELIWSGQAQGDGGELLDEGLSEALRAAEGEKRFLFSCSDEPVPDHWSYNQCEVLSGKMLERQRILLSASEDLQEPWRSLAKAGVYNKSKLYSRSIEMLEHTLEHPDLPNRAEILLTLKRLYEDVGNLPAAKSLSL